MTGGRDDQNLLERRVLEAEDFGFVPAANFSVELLVLGDALEEKGPETREKANAYDIPGQWQDLARSDLAILDGESSDE